MFCIRWGRGTYMVQKSDSGGMSIKDLTLDIYLPNYIKMDLDIA